MKKINFLLALFLFVPFYAFSMQQDITIEDEKEVNDRMYPYKITLLAQDIPDRNRVPNDISLPNYRSATYGGNTTLQMKNWFNYPEDVCQEKYIPQRNCAYQAIAHAFTKEVDNYIRDFGYAYRVKGDQIHITIPAILDTFNLNGNKRGNITYIYNIAEGKWFHREFAV